MDKRVRYIKKIERNYEMTRDKKENDGNLNHTELLALHYIRHHKGLTQDELSLYIGVDKALTTRMVKHFSSLDLIEIRKNEEDKRCNHLYPTNKLEDLKKEIVNEEELFYDDVLNVLSEEEKDMFLNLLTKVYLRSKEVRKNYEHEKFKRNTEKG